MNDFKAAFRIFIISALFEGVITLVYLIVIPYKTASAWWLGYTNSHWLVISLCLLLLASIGGFFVKTRRNLVWYDRVVRRIQDLSTNEVFFSTIWVVILLVVSLLIASIWLPSMGEWTFTPDLFTYRIGVYLDYFKPMLVWVSVLVAQWLVMMRFLGYNIHPSKKAFHLFSLVCCPILYIFLLSTGLDHYREITKEDRLVEWLTVGMFLITAVLAVSQAMINRKHRQSYWFLLAFSVACLLFSLEEISWGQRLFSVESSEFFLENSDQQEINVHNIINKFFHVRTKHVAAASLLLYGVVLPFLTYHQQVRKLIEKIGILVSPFVLIPGYIFSSILTWDRFFSGQDEEIAELLFSILLCLVVVYDRWYKKPNEVIEMEAIGNA